MCSSLTETGMTDAPLHGIRVLEFGQYIAVPAAGQALSDLGADVIKIEPPGGDTSRNLGWNTDAYGPMFSAYNRGKRSIVLDLRTEEGLQQALQLIETADVVLQNSRPGSMKKLGLGDDDLMPRFPRLIYGQVSAFGQTGPHSQRAGFDIAAQAEGGMMSLNGEAGRDPVRIGFTVVDVLAAQTLVSGVLAALLKRDASGKGSLVDVSLIDVAVAALSNAWTEYRLLDTVPIRRGNGQPTVAPAAEVLPTKDGMVVVSAYTEPHFRRLCEVIGKPELADDIRFSTNRARVKNRPDLHVELRAALSHLTSDAVCELLADAGLVVGAIRTMDQIKPGQAGVSRDLFVDVHADGRPAIQVPGLSFTIDGVQRQQGRLPALGEHTHEVLNELQKG